MSHSFIKTGVLDDGAFHEHDVLVQAGFERSSRKALSILNNTAATWLQVWLSLKMTDQKHIVVPYIRVKPFETNFNISIFLTIHGAQLIQK